MKTKEEVQAEIKKGCLKRLDEVYSVIMTFGKDIDRNNSETLDHLNKIDDIQNYLEEIL